MQYAQKIIYNRLFTCAYLLGVQVAVQDSSRLFEIILYHIEQVGIQCFQGFEAPLFKVVQVVQDKTPL